MKKLAAILAVLMLPAGLTSAATSGVSGTWSTVEGKSHVKIAPCGDDKFCGTITWLKEPNNDKGMPKIDANNQNENLRSRDIIGIDILKDLEKTGENAWDDGYIYNPEDGQTYSSEMKLLDDNTLEVKGCVLFFCKEQVWNRVQ